MLNTRSLATVRDPTKSVPFQDPNKKTEDHLSQTLSKRLQQKSCWKVLQGVVAWRLLMFNYGRLALLEFLVLALSWVSFGIPIEYLRGPCVCLKLSYFVRIRIVVSGVRGNCVVQQLAVSASIPGVCSKIIFFSGPPCEYSLDRPKTAGNRLSDTTGNHRPKHLELGTWLLYQQPWVFPRTGLLWSFQIPLNST